MEARGITSDSERKFKTEGLDFSLDLCQSVCREERTVDGRFKERDMGCIVGLSFFHVLPVPQ